MVLTVRTRGEKREVLINRTDGDRCCEKPMPVEQGAGLACRGRTLVSARGDGCSERPSANYTKQSFCGLLKWVSVRFESAVLVLVGLAKVERGAVAASTLLFRSLHGRDSGEKALAKPALRGSVRVVMVLEPGFGMWFKKIWKIRSTC